MRLFENVVSKASFFIPLVMALCQGITAESSASPILQQAHERLLSVKIFASGDAADYGLPCLTSEGERSFRALAESTNGLPLFKTALPNGTIAAIRDALCGIRHLAPEQFDSLAAPFTRTNSLVGVTVGSHKDDQVDVQHRGTNQERIV